MGSRKHWRIAQAVGLDRLVIKVNAVHCMLLLQFLRAMAP